ncbi:MAG: ribonuclease HII [Gallionella sp.]|nr:ribonuclease HII [Gallionella sp.]MDP1594194.1 ribonuclease HII [Gallionella sp.]MDP1939405.1 ribonuclease HII [Gallionella sp.]
MPLFNLSEMGQGTFDQAAYLICGVDEAGRGPLAGPVSAAAVMLDSENPIPGLNDSKKLSEKQRDKLAPLIRERALAWAVAYATVEEIDELNILQATLLAMKRAVQALSIQPQRVLVDGLYCPDTGIPSEAIVKGDSKVAAIAAASILAKTDRDALMLQLHEQYPLYGFDIHKGYPTAAHLAALRMHGVTGVHRKSFKPVRLLMGALPAA